MAKTLQENAWFWLLGGQHQWENAYVGLLGGILQQKASGQRAFGASWSYLGLSWRSSIVLPHLGAVLGLCWNMLLGSLGAVLEYLGDLLSSYGVLEPFWGHVGAILGCGRTHGKRMVWASWRYLGDIFRI